MNYYGEPAEIFQTTPYQGGEWTDYTAYKDDKFVKGVKLYSNIFSGIDGVYKIEVLDQEITCASSPVIKKDPLTVVLNYDITPGTAT